MRNSRFFFIHRLVSVLGGLILAVVVCVYYFDVRAQTDDSKNPAAQNLVNGRLAFASRVAGPTIPDGRIITVNPDGSGRITLPATLTQFASEPAWSPDGMKLAFASAQTPNDIYVTNADGSGQINLTNTASVRESSPSWSITGKIAYAIDAQLVTGQIWTMNADGSGQTQFSAITQPFPFAPAWSPDGTKLAFVSGGEIWVINADGTNERRVTTNTSTDTDPAWSPDGSKIVFTKGTATIAVINADGTNELTVATGGTQPSWSPDGTKIAYRGSGGVWTTDANGGNQVRIAADIILFPLCCDTIYEHPAWQPVAQTPNTFNITGRVTYNNVPIVGATVNLSGTIKAATTTDAVGDYQFSSLSPGGNYTVSPSYPTHYFTPTNRFFNNLTSNQTGNNFDVLGVCLAGNCVRNGKIAFERGGEIYTIFSDGTSWTNITNNTATDGQPNWSPDGSKVAFSTSRDGNSEIYSMEADGAHPVRLTTNTASDRMPYFSPDGSVIVFVSDRDGNDEIYKMNADGSNPVRLTNDAAAQIYPAFSPDGQKIVYVSGVQNTSNPYNLFTMNVDGSNQQQIPGPADVPSQLYLGPSFSPDGSKIIFSYTTDLFVQTPRTWTMNTDGTGRTLFGGYLGSYSPDGTKVAYTNFGTQINQLSFLSVSSLDGSSVQSFAQTTFSGTVQGLDWQPIPVTRPAAFDFDGDGRSDISVFRSSERVWYLLRSTAGFTGLHWGLSTDVISPADYDGDLKTDIAVWRPSDGNFYILNSFDSSVRIENFGLAGDIPTGGDWDADGKADVAVYRSGAQSTFYYRGSMGNPQGNISSIPWGTNGDKPVAGDYDGDGRADAAVYRAGIWYIRTSSNGQLSASNFGLADDVLVPADYDGDGKTDVAVFRNGLWYLLRSAQGFAAFQFGVANDVPTPADYDGDGRADASIFRNGIWWIMKSQSGALEAGPFGLGSDKPIASAFVR